MGEAIMLSATRLPYHAVGLSALAVYQLVNATSFQIPGAVRVAVSARIGKALGARRPDDAKRALRVGYFLWVVWMPVPLSLLLITRCCWGAIFTRNDAVIALIADLTPALVACKPRSHVSRVRVQYHGARTHARCGATTCFEPPRLRSAVLRRYRRQMLHTLKTWACARACAYAADCEKYPPPWLCVQTHFWTVS